MYQIKDHDESERRERETGVGNTIYFIFEYILQYEMNKFLGQ